MITAHAFRIPDIVVLELKMIINKILLTNRDIKIQRVLQKKNLLKYHREREYRRYVIHELKFYHRKLFSARDLNTAALFDMSTRGVLSFRFVRKKKN